jgi:hypothetical protein
VRLGLPPEKGAINNTIIQFSSRDLYVQHVVKWIKKQFFGTIEKSILLMSK